MKKILLISLVLALAITFNLQGQKTTLFPLKDNTIYSEGDSSNGKGNYLFVGSNMKGYSRRALIKFDLSAINPADSIVSASLQLYVSKTVSGPQIVKLYKLTHDWGEGISDAKYEEGGGAMPTNGDATWNYSFYDTALWKHPGGDYENSFSDSVEIIDTGRYTLSSNGLLHDVINWNKYPENNFGWIFICDISSASSKRFNSGNNPANPPSLTIQVHSNTGINHVDNTQIILYPIPSYGDLIIMNKSGLSLRSVKIFDLMGNELKINGLTKVILSPEFHLKLPKGVFILKINDLFSRKVIVY